MVPAEAVSWPVEGPDHDLEAGTAISPKEPISAKGPAKKNNASPAKLRRLRGRKLPRWTAVLGSSLAVFGIGSIACSSCAYPYIFSHLRLSHQTSTVWWYSYCSWVTLMQLIGILTALPVGSLLDCRIGPRWTVCLGALTAFAGTLGASFVLSSYWGIFLLYGLLQGLGVGLQLAPASTVPLRWLPSKLTRLSTMRATFLLASPCLFIPVILISARQPYVTGGTPAAHDSSGLAAVHTPEGYFTSSLSAVPSMLQSVAGIAFAFQLIGGLLIQNPPWYKRKSSQQSADRAGADGTIVSTSQEEDEGGSSPGQIQGDDYDPDAATVSAQLLPGESVAGFLKRCRTVRQAYLAHFIVPFTLSSVSGTTKKLDELYIQRRSLPSWARGSQGLSLLFSEAVRTKRFAFLAFLSLCHFFYSSSLYTYWRIAALLFGVPEPRLLSLSLLLTFFGLLCSLYWGVYMRLFALSSGFLITTFMACFSAWLLATAAASSPAALTISVVMEIFSIIGYLALVSQAVAVAFGHRPLGFTLFFLLSLTGVTSGILSGVTATLMPGENPSALARMFFPAATVLSGLAVVLLLTRCFAAKVFGELDRPVRRCMSDVDDEDDEEGSQSAYERSDAAASDIGEADDDEKRPIKLAEALAEFEDKHSRRDRASETADLGEPSHDSPDFRSMHYPVGIEPDQLVQIDDDEWAEAEAPEAQDEESDPEDIGSEVLKGTEWSNQGSRDDLVTP
ncbi:major facilitator family protein [Cystoisospora suis]|uniref:Major facilitator family protein n=1 Tax=Cystoisospora suis TaxID=483139 RepID=A0A2C6LFK2_9APIC|nr:major facilitator family protein [Cystoisospora suis]